MHDETDTIKELHLTYCGMSGQAIPFRFEHITWWNMWRSRKWTVEDLRFIIRYLKVKIRKGDRNQGCLKFTNLIKDLDRFEEDLAMARSEWTANERKPVYGEREKVLAATGRSAYLDTPAQSVDEVMRSSAAFEEFRKMKETLR